MKRAAVNSKLTDNVFGRRFSCYPEALFLQVFYSYHLHEVGTPPISHPYELLLPSLSPSVQMFSFTKQRAVANCVSQEAT
jgi:hypothetical protein